MTEPEQVVKEAKYLRDHVYDKAHDRVRDATKLYNSEINVRAPDNTRDHIPPVAFREVEKNVGQIATGYVQYDILPKETVDEGKSTRKLRSALEAIREVSNEINECDLDTETSRDGAISGMFPQKVVFSNERYLNGEMPVYFESVDPLALFPDPARRFVYEMSERYVAEIIEDIRLMNHNWKEANSESEEDPPWYEDWIDNFEGVSRDAYLKVLWVERWTKETKEYYVATCSLGQAHALNRHCVNHFGEIPYKWRFSGKGRGKKRKIEDRYVGVLHLLKPAIEAQARGLTAMDWLLAYHVFPEQYYKEGQERFFNAPTNPGQMRPIGDFEDIPQIGPEPRINPDLYNYLQMTEQHLQDLGGDPALLGQSTSDVSGRRFEGQVQQASLLARPMRKGLEGVKSEVNSMIARVIGNPFFNPPDGKGFSVNGKDFIKASDIQPHTKVKVTMEPKNPMFDQIRIEEGLRLYERSTIPLSMFVEDYLKIPDAINHIAKILAEKVMLEDETMRMRLVITALEEQGMDEEAEELRMAMQGAPTGQNAASSTQTIDSRAHPNQQGQGQTLQPNMVDNGG